MLPFIWNVVPWTWGIILLAGTLQAQQWERLPLDGGHLDRFWVNPYSERVIFACTQNKDLYRSVDHGLHWTRITNEAAPFKRTYLMAGDRRNAQAGFSRALMAA